MTNNNTPRRHHKDLIQNVDLASPKVNVRLPAGEDDVRRRQYNKEDTITLEEGSDEYSRESTKVSFVGLLSPWIVNDDEVKYLLLRKRPLSGAYRNDVLEVFFVRYLLDWRFTPVIVICCFLSLFWLINGVTRMQDPTQFAGYPPEYVSLPFAAITLVPAIVIYFFVVRQKDAAKTWPDEQQMSFLLKAELLYACSLLLAHTWSIAALYLEYVCQNEEDPALLYNCIGFSVPATASVGLMIFPGLRASRSLPILLVIPLFLVCRAYLAKFDEYPNSTLNQNAAYGYALALFGVCVAVCISLYDRRRRSDFEKWLQTKRLANELFRRQQTLHKSLNSWLPDDALLQISRGETITVRRTHCVIVASAVYDYSLWASRYLPRLAAELLDTLHCGFDRAAGRYGCDKVLLTGELYIASVGLRHLDALPLTQMIVNGISFGLYQRRVVQQISRGHKDFRMCVGVHCGAAHGSFIGVRKWIYGLVGPAPEGALALARVGMGHNEVIASDLALSSCEKAYSLGEERTGTDSSRTEAVSGRVIIGLGSVPSQSITGNKLEPPRSAALERTDLELSGVELETSRRSELSFNDTMSEEFVSLHSEDAMSEERHNFLASQVEAWLGSTAGAEARLGLDAVKEVEKDVEVRSWIFPTFAPRVEVQYHKQRQGMLVAAEWAQHVIYFGTAMTIFTTAVLEETHTKASLGCLIPATLLTIGRCFVAYRWRVHRYIDLAMQLIVVNLLSVGCAVLNRKAVFGHILSAHGMISFSLIFGLQQFLWLVPLAAIVEFTIVELVLFSIGFTNQHFPTIVIMVAMFGWSCWDREVTRRASFSNELLMRTLKRSAEQQLVWHRCLLQCLLPEFVVENALSKQVKRKCITMFLDQCTVADVRFPRPKETLNFGSGSSSLTHTSLTFCDERPSSPIASLLPGSGHHHKVESAMSELSTRFRIVEDILNQTPMSSLIGPVHVVGDTMRFAGPMLQPQEPEGRALEKSAVEMRRFLTGRTYRYQRKDSAETAWCMIRFLFALHRAIPGITACAAAESGFGSVLGETQPTFEVVGVVERIVSSVLRAAPVGFVGITEKFYKLLDGTKDLDVASSAPPPNFETSVSSTSMSTSGGGMRLSRGVVLRSPPHELTSPDSASSESTTHHVGAVSQLSADAVLRLVRSCPFRWRLRGVGYVSMMHVARDPSLLLVPVPEPLDGGVGSTTDDEPTVVELPPVLPREEDHDEDCAK